jgi:hypothetical protein
LMWSRYKKSVMPKADCHIKTTIREWIIFEEWILRNSRDAALL